MEDVRLRTYSSEPDLSGIGKRANHDLHLTSNRNSIKLPLRNLKMSNHPPARYSEIGCRIPKQYFWVIGWGESGVGIETGSYDAALHMAGIEDYNVMLYTSVLPPETVELAHLPDIHHGSVLEGIIAVQHTDKPGTRITAGLLMAKVYRNSNDSYLGGFACEYAGNGSIEEAEANLQEAMQQLFVRRYKTSIYNAEHF